MYSFGSNIPFDIYWDRLQLFFEFNDQIVLKAKERQERNAKSFFHRWDRRAAELERTKEILILDKSKVSGRLGNCFTSVDMCVHLILWQRKNRWACG